MGAGCASPSSRLPSCAKGPRRRAFRRGGLGGAWSRGSLLLSRAQTAPSESRGPQPALVGVVHLAQQHSSVVDPVALGVELFDADRHPDEGFSHKSPSSSPFNLSVG